MEATPDTVLRRGPGRPAKQVVPEEAVKPHYLAPIPSIQGRKVASVQFHMGSQFLAKVHTGLNVVKDQCVMTLVGPGVFIEIGERDYLVPFANIKHLEFEKL